MDTEKYPRVQRILDIIGFTNNSDKMKQEIIRSADAIEQYLEFMESVQKIMELQEQMERASKDGYQLRS